MTRDEAKAWIEETCGRGWLDLVDRAYDARPAHVTILQAFQKWGALRFDVDAHDEDFAEVLEAIEAESIETCERCGANGGPTILDGWETTLCDADFERAPEPKYRDPPGSE
ncbi:MAG: hypothetical protein R3B09_13500 [Nannocystaceae bacterium]